MKYLWLLPEKAKELMDRVSCIFRVKVTLIVFLTDAKMRLSQIVLAFREIFSNGCKSTHFYITDKGQLFIYIIANLFP